MDLCEAHDELFRGKGEVLEGWRSPSQELRKVGIGRRNCAYGGGGGDAETAARVTIPPETP